MQNGAIHGFPQSSFIAEQDFVAQYVVVGLEGTKPNYVDFKVDGTTPTLGMSQGAIDDTKADKAVKVVVAGYSLATSGGVIAIGDELMATADGKVIPATAGNYVAAVSLDIAAALNDIVEVRVVETYIKA